MEVSWHLLSLLKLSSLSLKAQHLLLTLFHFQKFWTQLALRMARIFIDAFFIQFLCRYLLRLFQECNCRFRLWEFNFKNFSLIESDCAELWFFRFVYYIWLSFIWYWTKSTNIAANLYICSFISHLRASWYQRSN